MSYQDTPTIEKKASKEYSRGMGMIKEETGLAGYLRSHEEGTWNQWCTSTLEHVVEGVRLWWGKECVYLLIL